MEEHAHIRYLFQQYLNNQHSPAELQELLQHFGMTGDGPLLKTLIQEALEQTPDLTTHTEERTTIAQRLDENVLEATRPVKKWNLSWIPYAAALILISFGIFFLVKNKNNPPTEILPGYNQATLTLADGTKVELDSAQRGIIVNNEAITYDNGRKVEGIRPTVEGEEVRQLVLSTPKGGQYQIILSDGTKVWLNAASTLKYPSRFSDKSREVFLEGEAYFEVNNKSAGDRVSRVPFIVKSKSQELLVLGTSFNISSYEGEKSVRTTLVTGSIQLASHVGPYALKLTPYTQKLVPGEQSIIQGDGRIIKAKVDINRELAWRDNKFSFSNKPFTQIMRELGRWFNLEVVYEGDVPTNTYFGFAYRTDQLSFVLDLLKGSNINYRLEGRKLIISTLKKEGRP